MAWGFSWDGGKMPMSIKSTVQLEQEAAEIMAMGGGVQFYFQQNRDLSLKPWLETSLSEIGKFCRQRQQFCHKAKAIPQIALLYPNQSYQRKAPRPYSNSTNMLQGALNLILDGQYPAEILMEHKLKDMAKYPLIVIPECDNLDSALIEEFRSYVKEGGNLLVLGVETLKLFEKELGIDSIKDAGEKTTFIAASGKLGGISSRLVSVKLNQVAQATATFYNSSDFRDKGNEIASSVNKVGKGTIAGVYFNAGTAYITYKSPVLRDFIDNIISGLFKDQLVKVSGSNLVHVAVNNLNNKMYVNLINTAGEHTNTNAIGYDEIPPLNNLMIQIRTGKKPTGIKLQPEGRSLKFQFMEGVSKVIVPELTVHSILEIIE